MGKNLIKKLILGAGILSFALIGSGCSEEQKYSPDTALGRQIIQDKEQKNNQAYDFAKKNGCLLIYSARL